MSMFKLPIPSTSSVILVSLSLGKIQFLLEFASSRLWSYRLGKVTWSPEVLNHEIFGTQKKRMRLFQPPSNPVLALSLSHNATYLRGESRDNFLCMPTVNQSQYILSDYVCLITIYDNKLNDKQRSNKNC